MHFLRLSLPCTLIRHENGAFRKCSSNPRILKTRALCFHMDGRQFDNGAYPKWWRHSNLVICPAQVHYPQTKTQSDRQLLLVLCFRFVICANIIFANSALTDKKVFGVFRHLVTCSLSFSFSGKILWKWTWYSFWPREFSLHFHGDCCILQQPLVLQTKWTEMQICQYLWPLPTSDHMFWCQLAVAAFSKVVYSCDSAFCNVWPYGRWAVRVDATNCGKMCWSEEDWPGVGLP